MNAVTESLAGPSPIAFGSLIDLAMLRIGTTAEICDACNTINLGSARCCKCCSHKLSAFYIAKGLDHAAPESPPLSRMARRVWALDFAAFWIMINSLVIVTALIPVS